MGGGRICKNLSISGVKYSCETNKLTPPQKLAFRICHGLNHVLPIAGVKEELPTFCIRDELNEICIPTHGEQEVKFVNAK